MNTRTKGLLREAELKFTKTKESTGHSYVTHLNLILLRALYAENRLY